MIEKVIINKTLLALIIRSNFNKEGVNFITPKQMSLQLGISKYKKNAQIIPHVHKRALKFVKTVEEVIYIIEGKVRVDLFLKNKKVITKILKSGDIILLKAGHGFKVLRDTKLFEIKHGPYINKEADKVYTR